MLTILQKLCTAPNYEPGFQDALNPNQEFLKSCLAYEIIFEERNVNNRNLNAIKADFEKSKNKRIIPHDLKKFRLILGKYGLDEVYIGVTFVFSTPETFF